MYNCAMSRFDSPAVWSTSLRSITHIIHIMAGWVEVSSLTNGPRIAVAMWRPCILTPKLTVSMLIHTEKLTCPLYSHLRHFISFFHPCMKFGLFRANRPVRNIEVRKRSIVSYNILTFPSTDASKSLSNLLDVRSQTLRRVFL